FWVYPDDGARGLADIRTGGGGGASDVRVGGGGLSARVLVAAGGGGAGAISWSMPYAGGPPAQLGFPMPPDLVGDGGDAGSAGRASQGWVGVTTYEPFDGTAVEGRTQLNPDLLPEGAVEGLVSAGGAGGTASGGAPGIWSVQPNIVTSLPRSTGEPGTLGGGGDGGRSTPWFESDRLAATAGGAGGGGLYGGGGGGGIGLYGSSSPLSGLVSGGGGGSSLGSVTGLYDGVDGYVEIVACQPGLEPTPSSTPSAAPSPSNDPAPVSGSGAGGVPGGSDAGDGSDPGRAQPTGALADTGPWPMAPVALVGAAVIATGVAAVRASRPRRGR
ncbi:MAG: hypothetical protein ACRCZP_05170, partial [Phycicoccus sp.]